MFKVEESIIDQINKKLFVIKKFLAKITNSKENAKIN